MTKWGDEAVEKVARAARSYYARMYGSTTTYAVCGSEAPWDSPPVHIGLPETEARNLAASMNARAAIIATLDHLMNTASALATQCGYVGDDHEIVQTFFKRMLAAAKRESQLDGDVSEFRAES